MRRAAWLVTLILLLIPLLAAAQTADYDLFIRNGRVVDGSGNAWYRADIAIRDGRIVRIAPNIQEREGATAKRVIDAQGWVVAPGFIDGHMHLEGAITRRPTADNLVADGVTSVVTGNCGGSEEDLGKFFATLKETGIGVNLTSLVGHGTVRRAVMGTENRAATGEELARMEALVAAAMEAGAVGLSTGLIYVPGTYAPTEEIVALARVAARYGGIYATHMRNEGEKVLEAMDEAIRIGREAGLPVEISHFKVSNKRFWGWSTKMLAKVERARAEGLDVTVDQYPYTASSTSLESQLPAWALAGLGEEEQAARETLQQRLADKAQRKKIADEMYERIRKVGGRKHLDYAVVSWASWDPTLAGKNIRQINREWKRKDNLRQEIETVLDMCAKGGASMVYHGMDEKDVARILDYEFTMPGRDGGVPEFGRGKPHPRSYGTSARVLGRYMRERKLLGLEEAVRKMTSAPAQRYGFQDRGLLREGMWADIVVFDPATVGDAATFDNPHQYSRGIHYVLVNGVLAVDGGQRTGARPGMILHGPGVRRAASSDWPAASSH